MRYLTAITSTLLLFTASLQAQFPIPQERLQATFNDPDFVEKFLSSYATLAGREPKPAEGEIDLLKELIEIIPNSPAQAKAMLEAQITDKSSGLLDMIMANLYVQTGDEENAIRYYQSCVRKYPDFLRAHKNLGLLYIQGSDFDNALKSLSTATELGDTDGRTYGLIGYCYLNRELYLPAETAYRLAVVHSPGNADWKLGLAQSLFGLEKFEEALGLFETLVAEAPDNAENWGFIVNAYLGMDQPGEAATTLEVIRRMGSASPENLSLLGDIYLNQQNFKLALGAYQEAMETGHGLPVEVPLRTADIMSRYGSDDIALKLIATIRARYADAITGQNRIDLLTLEATIAGSRGDDATAMKTLEQIVEEDATQGKALIELARVYKRTASRMLTGLKPGDEKAELLARSLAEKAYMRLEQAANHENVRAEALLTHGQMLVGEKHYGKALPLLRRAYKLRPRENLADYIDRVERASAAKSST